eukprot:7029551-Prymnesium_polylepis.1
MWRSSVGSTEIESTTMSNRPQLHSSHCFWRSAHAATACLVLVAVEYSCAKLSSVGRDDMTKSGGSSRLITRDSSAFHARKSSCAM